MLKGIGRTFTNCGTAAYIAPEILRGEGYDYRVDIWSLGVLISELVSGKTPFQAANTQKLYENIVRGVPTYDSKVNQIVRNLLQKIFATDPDDRMTLEQMCGHEYFRTVDFDQYKDGQIDAPWIPTERDKGVILRDNQTGAIKTKNIFHDSNQGLSFDEQHFK